MILLFLANHWTIICLEHVRQVFVRLKDAGLKINEKKCRFAVDEIVFLGFKIHNNSRGLSDDKIKVMKEFPVPKNVKEVQSALQ